MKLRRLILLPSDEDERTSDSAPEGENGPDWDLLTEVDRLRTTSSGLSAEVQRQTQIGQDYARAASEQRVRVEELERENAIAHSNCQMLERRLSQTEERAAELIKATTKIYRFESGGVGTSIAEFLTGNARLGRITPPPPTIFHEGSGKAFSTNLPPEA